MKSAEARLSSFQRQVEQSLRCSQRMQNSRNVFLRSRTSHPDEHLFLFSVSVFSSLSRSRQGLILRNVNTLKPTEGSAAPFSWWMILNPQRRSHPGPSDTKAQYSAWTSSLLALTRWKWESQVLAFLRNKLLSEEVWQ